MTAGRPSKLLPPERAEVLNAFRQYIRKFADPTIVGFCALDDTALKYNVTKDNIHDWREFSELRKQAISKQEAYLLAGATANKLNATFAIFRLKQPQHGYTDRQDHDHTTKGDKINPLGALTAEELRKLAADR